MKRTARELAALTDNFRRTLLGAGVRLTPQRLEIYRRAAATTDHPDIETIHRQVRKRMPGVSLDTVYRAMALFADLGLISTVRPLGHHIRFDANISPHHHFICTHCGAALDFEDPGARQPPRPPSGLRPRTRRLAARRAPRPLRRLRGRRDPLAPGRLPSHD
ncbi:MAG: transcriptional repressor, partial [Candidatus Aminicenantes bacterium]